MTLSETVALSVQPEGGGGLSFVRVGVGWAVYPPSGFGVGVGGAGIPLSWFGEGTSPLFGLFVGRHLKKMREPTPCGGSLGRLGGASLGGEV